MPLTLVIGADLAMIAGRGKQLVNIWNDATAIFVGSGWSRVSPDEYLHSGAVSGETRCPGILIEGALYEYDVDISGTLGQVTVQFGAVQISNNQDLINTFITGNGNYKGQCYGENVHVLSGAMRLASQTDGLIIKVNYIHRIA